MSVIHHGVHGFNIAQANLNRSGSEIAGANKTHNPESLQLNTSNQVSEIFNVSNEANLENSLIDLQLSKLHAQANSKVIATGNEVLGSILDIKV